MKLFRERFQRLIDEKRIQRAPGCQNDSVSNRFFLRSNAFGCSKTETESWLIWGKLSLQLSTGCHSQRFFRKRYPSSLKIFSETTRGTAEPFSNRVSGAQVIQKARSEIEIFFVIVNEAPGLPMISPSVLRRTTLPEERRFWHRS
ncbi:uncharacterized protein LOC143346538 [Colletes latitarsis]|uniref:uncharacterized protein LOC143346538 n=1 Tax=Colletes latitarsis TaxID=2605962 RepID=UPI004036335A